MISAAIGLQRLTQEPQVNLPSFNNALTRFGFMASLHRRYDGDSRRFARRRRHRPVPTAGLPTAGLPTAGPGGIPPGWAGKHSIHSKGRRARQAHCQRRLRVVLRVLAPPALLDNPRTIPGIWHCPALTSAVALAGSPLRPGRHTACRRPLHLPIMPLPHLPGEDYRERRGQSRIRIRAWGGRRRAGLPLNPCARNAAFVDHGCAPRRNAGRHRRSGGCPRPTEQLREPDGAR